MVIKVTFHDNDYGEILEDIGYLWTIGFHLLEKPMRENKEDLVYYIRLNEMWDKIIRNPNFRTNELEELDPDEKAAVIGVIRDWIIRYINLDDRIEDNEKQLLIRDLEVSLTLMIDESNQNGEYLYYIVQDRVSILR